MTPKLNYCVTKKNNALNELVWLSLHWPRLRIDGIKENRLGGKTMAESNPELERGMEDYQQELPNNPINLLKVFIRNIMSSQLSKFL